MLANQSESQILNMALWLVGQHQIHGGNFKFMDHVKISVALKDSRVRLSLESLTSYAYFFCVSFGICLHSPPVKS